MVVLIYKFYNNKNKSLKQVKVVKENKYHKQIICIFLLQLNKKKNLLKNKKRKNLNSFIMMLMINQSRCCKKKLKIINQFIIWTLMWKLFGIKIYFRLIQLIKICWAFTFIMRKKESLKLKKNVKIIYQKRNKNYIILPCIKKVKLVRRSKKQKKKNIYMKFSHNINQLLILMLKKNLQKRKEKKKLKLLLNKLIMNILILINLKIYQKKLIKKKKSYIKNFVKIF